MSYLVLYAMTYLLAKHVVADYFMQTPYQFQNKGRYGHPGGALHAGIHAALTAPVFLLLPPHSLMLACGILAGEFLVHYHVDFVKERMVRGLSAKDNRFWQLFGIDQFVHHLTYIVIVWALLSAQIS